MDALHGETAIEVGVPRILVKLLQRPSMHACVGCCTRAGHQRTGGSALAKRTGVSARSTASFTCLLSLTRHSLALLRKLL